MKLILFSEKEYKEITEKYNEFLDSIVERNPKTGNINYIRVPELEYRRVSTWSFSKILIPLGLTRQEWVNIHMFGDKEIVPLCPYCKVNPLKFNMWDYRLTCCSKECKGDWLSDQFKNNEDYIKKLEDSREEGLKKGSETKRLRRKEAEDRIKEIGLEKYLKEVEEKKRIDNEIKDEQLKKKLKKREIRKKDAEEMHNREIERYKERLKKKEEKANRPIDPYHYIVRGKRSTIYSMFEGKEIHFDSSWERKFWEYMSKNPNVKSIIRYHKIKIKYFNNEFNRYKHYVPDFLIEYINGEKEISEIKPSKYLPTSDATDKVRAGRDYSEENGFKYKVYTEIELKELGLLDMNFTLSSEIPRGKRQ